MSEPVPDQKKYRDYQEYYEAVDSSLRKVFVRHFPEQAASFTPSSISKKRGSYDNRIETVESWGSSPRVESMPAQTVRDSLKTVTIIRYIDDFLDDYVWHNIDFTNPSDAQKYQAFLDDLFIAGRALDNNLTQNSFEIFRVEAALMANPTQENFDQNIQRLFRAKAFDMLLVYCQLHKLDPVKSLDQVRGMGIADFARDFWKPAHGNEPTSTDFDLYVFLRDNKLNPQALIDYVEGVFQEEEPGYYKQYKEGQTIEEIFGEDDYNDAYVLIVHMLNVLEALR